MSRDNSLINESLVIGFRHIYNGILMDVSEMVQVEILDTDFQSIYVIPKADITRLEFGTYTAVIPANVLNKLGTWHDRWQFYPTQTSGIRNLIFDISVVNTQEIPDPTTSGFTEKTMNDLTPCNLKREYLWPVWSVLQNGYYLTDHILNNTIEAAMSWCNRVLGIYLKQMKVMTKPFDDNWATEPVKGKDYDIEGKLLQWSAVESLNWCQVSLPYSNVSRILSLRGIYGGRTVYRIPPSWVDGNHLKMGIVRVRPTTTGAINSIIDNSGRFLDVTLLESIGANFVPGFWAIDLVIGDSDSFAHEIYDLVMKKAAVQVLEQLSMSITKGIASRSASVDGLSSSIGYLASQDRGMFGALCANYEQSLSQENINEMRKYYKGFKTCII